MKIKIVEHPDRKITQSVLFFQVRFMELLPKEAEYQDDRFGSLPFGYVIGYQNKEMVGVVNLLKRRIKFNKQSILVGGFGGVAVHSKFRRQGIATVLLQQSLQTLKKHKCDIAFLNTDLKKLLKLYANIGFVPLKRKYQAIGASGKIYYGKGGMIVPIMSKKIFNEVLRAKEVFNLHGQDW